jgi:hypothetical protein
MSKRTRSTTDQPSPSVDDEGSTITHISRKKPRTPQTCHECHRPRAGINKASIVVLYAVYAVLLSTMWILLGIQLVVDGQRIIRRHSLDCKIFGKCVDVKSCGYVAGHREQNAAVREEKKVLEAASKLKKQEVAAAIAGMKSPTSKNFDIQLNQAFSSANLDK